MPTLAEFQTQFAHNLLQPEPASAAFAVYLNTVAKGCIDALAANFPSVQALVGDEWFNAAALAFARQSLPVTPVLANYGKGFPAFLKEFTPTEQLPYLPEVARLDWLWIESYFAADGPILKANELQAMEQQSLFDSRIELHPATRFATLKHSAVTIWLANHPSNAAQAKPSALEVADEAEAVSITRARLEVRVQKVSANERTFLEELATQATLGEAAATVLAADPSFPLAASFARMIDSGAFSRVLMNPQ